MYAYEVNFTNGKPLVFTSEEDIEFHDLKLTAICFNDLFINMTNVTYIEKCECVCGNCKYQQDKKCHYPGNEIIIDAPNDDLACDGWKKRG